MFFKNLVPDCLQFLFLFPKRTAYNNAEDIRFLVPVHVFFTNVQGEILYFQIRVLSLIALFCKLLSSKVSYLPSTELKWTILSVNILVCVHQESVAYKLTAAPFSDIYLFLPSHWTFIPMATLYLRPNWLQISTHLFNEKIFHSLINGDS